MSSKMIFGIGMTAGVLAMGAVVMTYIGGPLLAEDARIPVLEKAPEAPQGKVEKSQREWHKLLTEQQFAILRLSKTEPAGGTLYQDYLNHGPGYYYCAGCKTELFSSNERYLFDTGWPSFFAPSKEANVGTRPDDKFGTIRTEVFCSICGGHLGHVFQGEGYSTPTNLRYCINGAALLFFPTEDARESASSGESE